MSKLRCVAWLAILATAALAAGCSSPGLSPTDPTAQSDLEITGPLAGTPSTPTTSPTTRPRTQPTTRPSRTLLSETFDRGLLSSEGRWVLSNLGGQRVVVQEGALVVRADARDRAARVELQVQESLPALGRWTLEFDALVNSLGGGGRGEVRVELRDYAARTEPEGNDLVLAERYWDDESGLKFGVFHGGAFVGWHEVAPVGALGAWHHYRITYEAGLLTLWRDGKRALECEMIALLDQPLIEGVAVEMGFHVPKGSAIEACMDNVTIVAEDE